MENEYTIINNLVIIKINKAIKSKKNNIKDSKNLYTDNRNRNND